MKVKAATGQPIPAHIDADGDVYNLVPVGAEPARLGVMVRPLGGLSKIPLEASQTLRTSDGGLTATLDDLPTSSGGLETWIESVTLTLFGRPPGARGAILYNPTSCAPGTARITATPYGAGPARTRATTFTATGCDRLPFRPYATGTSAGRRSRCLPRCVWRSARSAASAPRHSSPPTPVRRPRASGPPRWRRRCWPTRLPARCSS